MKIIGIIALIAAIACLSYFIYKVIKAVKEHVIGETVYKVIGKERTELISLSLLTGGLLSASTLALCLAKNYSMKGWEYFLALFGSLLFGVALCVALGAFILYYYKNELDAKQKKFCKFAFPICFALVVLGLYLFTEGVANHIIYPLVSGFSIPGGAIRGGDFGEGFQVKFYGILIVSGALLCYAITEHYTYRKFKEHGLVDTLFLVAFLFGILGARLWYCFVLEPDYFLSNPGEILVGIVNGGLAVQGGALLGITAGVTFMLLFRKYIDLRFMMDVAIPTILLAQMFGRWGNFFNQEVYGQIVDPNKLWYLPTIVKNNMLITENGITAYRVPLFFIEGMMNLCGFFIIRFLLGKLCKFRIGLGYQASCYLIWYGMVRVVLEHQRESSFEYNQSWTTALIMMFIGLTMLTSFFIYHHYRMDKGIEDEFGEKL